MIFLHRASAVSTEIRAGDLEVGQEVLLHENGVPANYLVVHQGLPSGLYDASCEGTWLLRKDIAENRVWDSGNSNVLEASDIQAYLNGDWLANYDAGVQSAIKQIKLPYRKNGGSGGTDQSGGNGLSCKVFLLSGYEVGWTTSNSQYFPVDGAVLSYFQGTATTDAKRIAKLNGNADSLWWLRSPYMNNTSHVWSVLASGYYGNWNAGNAYGLRPALILPYDFIFPKSEVAA